MPSAAASSSARSSVIMLIALLALAFAAYGTTALDFRFFADDAVLTRGLTDSTAEFLPARQGAWRLLGNSLMMVGLGLAPKTYMALVVAAQGLNAFLAWAILRRLGAQPALSALAAALLAVSPGGHEAVALGSATHYVWSTTLFLLSFLLTLKIAATPQPSWTMAGGCFLSALVGSFIHDQYGIAYFTLPAAALWLATGRLIVPLDWRRALALVLPAVASGLYILAYFATLHATTTKHLAPNASTLISPFVYQYLNFAAFDVWRLPIWVAAFFQRMASPTGLAIVASLSVGTALLWRHVRQTSAATTPVQTGSLVFAAAWSGLLLGLAAVYAMSGAYQLESRKRYALVLFGLLAFVHLFGRVAWRRWLLYPLLGLIVVCTFTTVALTEARNGLLAVKDQLCTAIIRNEVPPATYLADREQGPARIATYLWTDLWVELEFDYMWRDIWEISPIHSTPSGRVFPFVSQRAQAQHVAAYDWSKRQWGFTPVER